MDLTEHLYSVRIVSAVPKFADSLIALLPRDRYAPVTVVPDAAEARRSMLENPADIVVIHTPLPDEFGNRLALDLCRSGGAGVLLLVRAEHYPDVNARVSPYGVLVLSRPTSSSVLLQTLSLLYGTRERLRQMERKTASLEEKMEEIRLVNRAKWLLIEQLKMTEPDAHRYLEKTAMDRCVSKRSVAESIIKLYQS